MEAISGKGTILKISDNGTPTPAFTEIKGVRNLTGPNQTMETVDITTLSSPGDSREVLPTFKDGGEISFDLLWDPSETEHQGLEDAYNDKLKQDFKIVFDFATPVTYTFKAYVTNLGVSTPHDDVITRPVTLKLTGEVTAS